MEGDFFLLNGDSVKVPFMTSYKEQYIKTFDDFKVLRLPYKQGEDKRQFSMYIFLPNVKDGLSNLVQKVCSRDGFVNNNLVHCEKVLVDDFRLPKFKISFGFEASEVLKNLGVELPFMGGGLMKVIDSYEAKYLYVSSIIQKSFIEINEEGTEAAAATAIQASVQCLMIPKVESLLYVPRLEAHLSHQEERNTWKIGACLLLVYQVARSRTLKSFKSFDALLVFGGHKRHLN
uniref:Serpin domain-containing protein n=1 Tax=Chenopodium quinoa TaxID=63459 RepID=A0A803MGK6_CHEQI